MRSVTYSMSVSLDGYIVGPDGDFDWTVPGEEVFRFDPGVGGQGNESSGRPPLIPQQRHGLPPWHRLHCLTRRGR